ncbi:Protein croquemort [Halotydeus destructor]|nr:Protein croquemort [Halotydeus destructor]
MGCCSKWVRFFALVTVCLSLLISAIITLFVVPSVIDSAIKEALPIVNVSSSKTYENWRQIPLPIINNFYLFNVTNSEAIIQNQSKPILEELGPFVYEERREKIDIEYNEDETLATYRSVRRYYFRPDLTKGSLDDIVVHLNVPLIGSGEYVYRYPGDMDDKTFLYNAISEMANYTDSTLFQSHSVRELLFEGYQDDLIDEAAQMGGFKIPFDKFAWFYGRNGTSSDGLYTIHTGQDDLDKMGQMYTWNNSSRLAYPGECGSLEDTSASDFQRPFADPPSDHVKVFVGDICRSLRLNFVGQVDYEGVQLNRYEAGPDLFDYSIDSNKCYCDDGECPKNGIHNTSACTFDSPAAVSMAHFLYADESYVQRVDGLSPDKDKHGFLMDVHPMLGIAGNIAVRMQINVAVRRDEHVDWTKDMKEDIIYYPVLWFSATAQLDEANVSELKMLQNTLTALPVIGIALFVIVVALAIITIKIYWDDIMFKMVNKANSDRNRGTRDDALNHNEVKALKYEASNKF